MEVVTSVWAAGQQVIWPPELQPCTVGAARQGLPPLCPHAWHKRRFRGGGGSGCPQAPESHAQGAHICALR